MKDYTKNISRWIDGLTKDQFDDFIKVFLKNYWNVETVVLTDGKGDGGIDVKILTNKINKRIPLQVTIDKNVYSKLEKDLVKISKLISEFDYSENFFFYYSRGAAEGVVISLIDKARKEYGINLEIFNNKLLAEYLDKPEYIESRQKLREILGDFLKDEKTFFDENDKLRFDLLSYSTESIELKERFIYAFILNEFFISTKDQLSKSEIVHRLETEFNLQSAEYYCEKIVSSLLTKHKIEKVTDDTYKITDTEKKNLENIKEDSSLLEREFLTNLEEILKKAGLDEHVKEVVELLYKVFKRSNKVDAVEISESLESIDDSDLSTFYKYFSNKLENKRLLKNIIREIFSLCSENHFIIKVSAGNVYRELINSSEYDSYSRRVNKEVFLDTPVLIYLLLAMKEPDFEYDNYQFSIAKSLFGLITSGDQTAIYNTTEPYIIELADYVRNTIKLAPLYDEGLLESLGGSSNELINMFINIKEKGFFDGNLSAYIEDFGINISKVRFDDKNEYLQQFLIKLFKDNNINVDIVADYDRDYKSRTDYTNVAKTLGDIYSRAEINRKPRSLRFDCLLFMHIYFVDADLTDPTVLTWDNTFRDFRNEFQSKNPNYRYWHLFKPGKYLDHVALLKFKINGKAITNEILSMIETEFEVVKGVKKLTDVLASIVDLKSATGTKLSKGLAHIRDVYIYEIGKEIEDKELDSVDSQPVDEILSTIFDYYHKSEGPYTFDDFTKTLQIEAAVTEVLELLRRQTDYYIKYNKYSDNFRHKFDRVIKKYQSIDDSLPISF
ncbi:hypothetical protein [Flavobacterium sp.]|uniref:hypothetical protein n=1 Tax=Flavobacterium sp. TaxID=239 RepID=UPI0039E39722